MRPIVSLLSGAIVAMVALAIVVQPARAERRVAMVVGIDTYPALGTGAQLQRAVADADSVGDALKRLGFAVTTLSTGPAVTQDYFLKQFSVFLRDIQPGDMAVFYFAGHGVGLNGANYLAPADMPDLDDADEYMFRAHALAESDIRARMASRGPRVVLLMLDACRNNPFRSTDRTLALSRGLQPIESSKGVLTIYAAGYGQTALDRLSDVGDRNPNSVFTRVVIGELNQPGVNLVDFSEDVREKVAEIAHKAGFDQVPAVDNQLIGGRSIYLGGAPVALPVPPTPVSLGPDEIAWGFVRNTSDTATLRRFLDEFPGSPRNAEVRSRLADLEAQSHDPVPTAPRPDEKVWDAVSRSSYPADIRMFTDGFPNSPLRGKAEERLAALDEDLWRKTPSEDIVAQRHYLALFPQGTHVAQAQAFLVSLEKEDAERQLQNSDNALWKEVDGTNTYGLHRYLTMFPGGLHAGQAQTDLSSLDNAPRTPPASSSPMAASPPVDEVAWATVASTTFPEEIREFLARFPATALREKAEQRLAALDDDLWRMTSSEDSVAQRHYIASFPQGIHVVLARAYLTKLERVDAEQQLHKLDDESWNSTSKTDSGAQRRYLSLFPDGLHADESRALLASLEQDVAHAKPQRAASGPHLHPMLHHSEVLITLPARARHREIGSQEAPVHPSVHHEEVAKSGPASVFTESRPNRSIKNQTQTNESRCFDVNGDRYCP